MNLEYYNIGVIGIIILILGYILAYVTSLWNKSSTISFNLQQPHFSISQAMHFGNKKLITSTFLIGSLIVCGSFLIKAYKSNQYILQIINICLFMGVFLLLISLSFMKNVYTCDCKEGAILPTCCYDSLDNNGNEQGNITKTGDCTYDKVKTIFKHTDLGDPICCNPPSCTPSKNLFMSKNHMIRAYIISILIILFVIINGISFKNHTLVANKTILLLALIGGLGALFAYWDRPGDKYKLVFGICESISIPLFLIIVIISLQSKL